MRKRMYEYQARLKKQKLVTGTLRQRIKEGLNWRTSTPLPSADSEPSQDKILSFYHQLPVAELGILASAQGSEFYSCFVTLAYAPDSQPRSKEDLIKDLQTAATHSHMTLEEALITYNIRYPNVREWLLTSQLQRYETKREAYRTRVLSLVEDLTHLEEIFLIIKDVLYRAKPIPEESQRIIKKQYHLLVMEAERCDLSEDVIDVVKEEPIKVNMVLVHDHADTLQIEEQVAEGSAPPQQAQIGTVIPMVRLREVAQIKRELYDTMRSLPLIHTLFPYKICWIMWQYLFHPVFLYPDFPFQWEDAGFELIN